MAAVENIKQFIVRHCNIVKPNYTRAIALAASDTSSVIEISEDISNIWCAVSHFSTTKTLQALLIRLLSEIYISSGDDSINIGYLKFIEIISCLQIGNPPDSF